MSGERVTWALRWRRASDCMQWFAGRSRSGSGYVGASTSAGGIRFATREEARAAASKLVDVAIVKITTRHRLVSTRRARAAAQADADNVATMRAELEGPRATDEEMAAKLAKAQREIEERRAFVASICEALGGEFGPAVVPAIRAMRAALATARHHRDHAMSFESQSRALVESLSTILGAAVNESVDEAAKRVVRERDDARRALAPPTPHVAFLQRLSDATGIEVASDDFEARVLAFVHDLASMRSEILDLAARTPRAITVKATPC